MTATQTPGQTFRCGNTGKMTKWSGRIQDTNLYTQDVIQEVSWRLSKCHCQHVLQEKFHFKYIAVKFCSEIKKKILVCMDFKVNLNQFSSVVLLKKVIWIWRPHHGDSLFFWNCVLSSRSVIFENRHLRVCRRWLFFFFFFYTFFSSLLAWVHGSSCQNA